MRVSMEGDREHDCSTSATPIDIQAPWICQEQCEFLNTIIQRNRGLDLTGLLREKIEVIRQTVYRCFCNNNFDTENELNDHVSAMHPGQPLPHDNSPKSFLIRYQCRQCGGCYNVLKEIFQHLKIHDGQRLFTYPLRLRPVRNAMPTGTPHQQPSPAVSMVALAASQSTPEDLVDEASLAELEPENSEPGNPTIEFFYAITYKCPICLASYFFRSEFESHMEVEHPQESYNNRKIENYCDHYLQAYKCLKCLAISRSWLRMCEHLHTAHQTVGKADNLIFSKRLPSQIAAEFKAARMLA